ncbi:MAG: hypothetical protein Q4Q17_00020 [Tissierellia bacterium]|nr:hypothetical protein [Tissierellia bacterium]
MECVAGFGMDSFSFGVVQIFHEIQMNVKIGRPSDREEGIPVQESFLGRKMKKRRVIFCGREKRKRIFSKGLDIWVIS